MRILCLKYYLVALNKMRPIAKNVPYHFENDSQIDSKFSSQSIMLC